MKPMTRHVIAALAAMAMVPSITMAQSSRNMDYLGDTTQTVVRSGTGLCWHTSNWTSASESQFCDPVTPVAAAPAPAPAPVVAAVRPAPAPVAAPAPVIVAQPAPAKPLLERMSFSADALFAFDKAELKPEGKVMLDDLVSQISSANYDLIQATGHADRIGSTDYNQRLSERRAAAVKDYLVSRNVLASRIEAEGKGETQPMTKAADCAGRTSPKIIACLQPDRRVDVEMKGTKTVASSR